MSAGPSEIFAARRNRVAIALLILVSSSVNFYRLSINHWANAFYSGAAQAGAQNWKAWLFGSSDPENAISVDKIPAALWPQGLSVRVFGLHPWAILLPQALMGIACVLIVYATVRRAVGTAGGFTAGFLLTVTPVAAEMFRFNNPDALLTLLMTLSVWATVRAIETSRTRWVILAGVFTGLAFLAKMLQGLLLVPVLLGVFLLLAAPKLVQRVRAAGWAALATVASVGWYIALVELTPTTDRPYVSSTLHNSIIELTFGYNGFGRLTGKELPAWLVGNAATGRVHEDHGLLRLFGGELATQISWLIPTAVVLALTGLILTARAPRTDPVRAQLMLWGGWLVVVGGVLSLMRGIVHAYYTVALAPAIAALVGLGVGLVWRSAGTTKAVLGAATALLLGTWWSWRLLERTHGFHPHLRYLVVLLAAGALVALVAWHLSGRVLVAVTAWLLAFLSLGAAPMAYTKYTITHPTQGAIVVAGPPVDGGFDRRLAFKPRPGRGFHGPAEAAIVSPTLRARLRAVGGTWPVASIGATTAALFQLGIDRPTLAIGGYTGLDPYPTLADFKKMAATGQVAYLYRTAGPASVGTKSPKSQAYQIWSWANANCPLTKIDTTAFFDLARCKNP